MTCNTLAFLSRHCKANHHYECSGRRFGLGLEVYYHCCCHTKKEGALEVVPNPATNATEIIQSPEEDFS